MVSGVRVTAEFVYNDFGGNDSSPITTIFRRSR